MDAETRRYKIASYGEQQLEALGFAPKVEFELNDGSIVEVYNPWLWSDATEAAYDREQSAQNPKEPYNTRIARAVLGKDLHKRFVEGGGRSSQVVLAIELMKRDRVENKAGASPKG